MSDTPLAEALAKNWLNAIIDTTEQRNHTAHKENDGAWRLTQQRILGEDKTKQYFSKL
ncbi:MAG: hypothetical protein PVF28_02390 [Thioalkalispiraceae bacterium]|jgi:hypothetical protein